MPGFIQQRRILRRGGAATVASPSSPLTLWPSNLKHWTRPEAAYVTLTGAQVDATLDQSGNGDNLAWQWDKPTWSATSWGGGPGFDFDNPSTDQFLKTATATINTSGITVFSAFVGFLLRSASLPTGYKQIVGMSSGTLGDYEDLSGLAIARRGSTNNIGVSMAGQEKADIAINADQEYNLICVYNGSTIKVYLDGVEVQSSSATAVGAMSNTYLSYGIGVGPGFGNVEGEAWHGEGSEMGILGGIALSPTQVTQLNDWMAYRKLNPGAV